MSSPVAQPYVIKPPRRRTFLRKARRVAFWLFGGMVINVAVALGIAGYTDPSTGTLASASASAVAGDENWSVMRFETRGAIVVVSDFTPGASAQRSWSAQQVLGPPNTSAVGDIGTAWAQSTQDGQEEWLDLTYAQPVVPKSVRVYETYNQGSLFKVVAYNANTGEPVNAWEGTDPSPHSDTVIGISEVPLHVDFPTRRIKIFLDSVRVKGWNEIDAVGLVDRSNNVQWAMKVRASTVYGQGAIALPAVPASANGPEGLLPPWGDLHDEPDDPESHVVGAYGWPMRSLWGSWKGPPSLSGVTTATPTAYPVLLGPGTGAPSGSTYTTLTSTALPVPLAGPPTQPPVRIAAPYHPILAGMAVNSLVFAVPVALIHLFFTSVPRFFLEVSRVRRGACVRCGYDLQWDFINGCSECGWRRPEQLEAPMVMSNGDGARDRVARHSNVE